MKTDKKDKYNPPDISLILLMYNDILTQSGGEETTDENGGEWGAWIPI